MKNTIKKAICAFAVIVSTVSMSVPAFAYGEGFGFTVYKNKGVQKTEPVSKNDNEAQSYVTLERVMWSTKDPWVFGARVRSSNGTALIWCLASVKDDLVQGVFR